ncbi:MAG TPA: bifunctional riboflavin kinase/FAD synthetase [Burkholderiales bacterium]|nr:bifunctional riboflavin kinase/FAD synthetase [Burkholderiales bacterium]
MRVLRRAPVQAEQSVALTIGNFDGVHLGHRTMLERLVGVARSRNLAAAVMTFEPQPQEFFAPDQAPARLASLREKLELLHAAGVDTVFVCHFDYQMAQISAADFVARIVHQALGTKWLLIGDDFRFGARRSGDFDLLMSLAPRYGYEVEATRSVLHEGTRVSSTAVRARLQAGDLDAAAALLGRSYCICGRVERGDGIGTGFGYPTANVRLNRLKAPLAGIFVVEVEGLGDRVQPGVASLGVRPTVTSRGKAVLEVHLFDFNRDIYGRRVRVRFLSKLRDETKFASVDELVKQMDRDAARAREYFDMHGVSPAQSMCASGRAGR